MTHPASKATNSLETKASNQGSSQKQEDLAVGTPDKLGDSEFQSGLLEGVSRTFALTIPQLPEELLKVVANAYLLCRTIDTIEDEPNLSFGQKSEFSNLFVTILEGKKKPICLIKQLMPLLSDHTIPAEHSLIQQLDRVVRITQSFSPQQQQSLVRCVKIMSEGMVLYQKDSHGQGLKNQAEMDRYCYFVAGVVGEMLTELYCHYSAEIRLHRDRLVSLSRSFGQGLQMTNILKDIWDDHARSACWLPRDLFDTAEVQLKDLPAMSGTEHFDQGLKQLIGIAHGHLENALSYTLMIPTSEIGIRKFCLWALGMAMLTLRKINANLNFTDGVQVKISRNSVKTTIGLSNFFVKNDRLLKLIFNLAGSGLDKRPVSLVDET